MVHLKRSAKKMACHLNRRWGACDENPSIEKMREALTELEVEDIEHPDVALIHESGWCLGAYPSGLLVWEHLEGDGPRHMKDVSREQVLEIWLRLAAGDIASVNAHAWRDGYG